MAAAQLLLVEDDNAMREMLESLFRQEGYVVSEASSASVALDLARQTDFDVVLSDIKMPGKSGLELVGELRELRPDMPVVLMTAFGNVETAVDAMRAGAFGYTTKPFQPAEVIRTVKRALDRRGVDDVNGSLRGANADPRVKELIGDSDLLNAADLVLASPAEDDASAGDSTERGLIYVLTEAARNGLTLRQLEDLYIEQMLRVTGGKKGEAATRLGIDRKTLYRRDPTH